MQTAVMPIFEGLSAAELAVIEGRLACRRYMRGDTLVAEGDTAREMLVITSGTADVFITNRHGEHLVNQVGPGSTLGEMSLLTGQPASATVRAATDLAVLVMSEWEFQHTASAYPRIYLNLGAILSERLNRSTRRSIRHDLGRITVLHDEGAPPLLGYALACGLAWQTGAPVLLVVVAEEEAPDLQELARVNGVEPAGGAGSLAAGGQRGGVRLILARSAGPYGPEFLARTLTDLAATYEYVLVQVRGDTSTLKGTGLAALEPRRLRLIGAYPEGHRDRPAHTAPADFTLVAWASGKEPRPDAQHLLRVPETVAADHEQLAKGLLSAQTACGRALGWAARHIAGQKIGVALGGGAAKGYAHLGVMQVLAREGIAVDYLAGTSIGAAVGLLWASGHNAEAAAHILDMVGAAAFRPTLPIASLLSSTALRQKIRRIAGGARLEDLRIPLAIVAADILTRSEIVFRHGPIETAVVASMAIPGIYPPQRVGRHLLVDGGVLNPVPSNVAADMGADTVIAVRLAGKAQSSGAAGAHASGWGLGIIQTIMRSIDTMQSKIATDTAAAATIVIEPELTDAAGWGLRHFSDGRRYMEAGVTAAEAALPRIMPALRRAR